MELTETSAKLHCLAVTTRLSEYCGDTTVLYSNERFIHILSCLLKAITATSTGRINLWFYLITPLFTQFRAASSDLWSQKFVPLARTLWLNKKLPIHKYFILVSFSWVRIAFNRLTS